MEGMAAKEQQQHRKMYSTNSIEHEKRNILLLHPKIIPYVSDEVLGKSYSKFTNCTDFRIEPEPGRCIPTRKSYAVDTNMTQQHYITSNKSPEQTKIDTTTILDTFPHHTTVNYNINSKQYDRIMIRRETRNYYAKRCLLLNSEKLQYLPDPHHIHTTKRQKNTSEKFLKMPLQKKKSVTNKLQISFQEKSHKSVTKYDSDLNYSSDDSELDPLSLLNWRCLITNEECSGYNGQLNEINEISTSEMPLVCSETTNEVNIKNKKYKETIQDINILHSQLIAKNYTLTTVSLSWRNIGDNGAELLADGLKSNTILFHLSLDNNKIGNKGVEALAKCLTTNNKTLSFLDLGNNNIGNDGAIAFAHCIRTNEILMELRLVNNCIGDKGIVELIVAVHHNVVLRKLVLYHDFVNSIDNSYYHDEPIQREINAVIFWNSIGPLSHGKVIQKLTPPCKDRVIYILLLLSQVSLCHDFNWIIMNMLKVRDVVMIGNPRNSSSWT